MKLRVMTAVMAAVAGLGIMAAAQPAQAHEGWCRGERVAGWRDDYRYDRGYGDRYAGYDSGYGYRDHCRSRRSRSVYYSSDYGYPVYDNYRSYRTYEYRPRTYRTYRVVRSYPVARRVHYRRVASRAVCAPHRRVVKVVRITKVYR